MADSAGRGRPRWRGPVGWIVLGVVGALAIGGVVWAITTSSNMTNATGTHPKNGPGAAGTTTTTAPAPTSSPGASTPTPTANSTPKSVSTVVVPNVVTGTVVSAAELTLQQARLQYNVTIQSVSACTLPSGAYNQNAVLWQNPAAGSVVAVGSQILLGIC
jgi:cytoskeletal protein RodZ